MAKKAATAGASTTAAPKAAAPKEAPPKAASKHGGLKGLLKKGKADGAQERSKAPVVQVTDPTQIGFMLKLEHAKRATKSVATDLTAAETALTPFAKSERLRLCRGDKVVYDSIKLHAVVKAKPGPETYGLRVDDLTSEQLAEVQKALTSLKIPFATETHKEEDIDLLHTGTQQKRCCEIDPEQEDAIRAVLAEVCCDDVEDEEARAAVAAKLYEDLFAQESTVVLNLDKLPDRTAIHEVLRRILGKIDTVSVAALNLDDDDADALSEACEGRAEAMAVKTMIKPRPKWFNDSVLVTKVAKAAARLAADGIVVPFKFSFRT